MELGAHGTGRAGDGGLQGIGRAVAAGLAGEGCRVAIAARGGGGPRETAEALGSKGAEVLTVAADLTEPDAPRRVVDAVVTVRPARDPGEQRRGDPGRRLPDHAGEQWADDWRLKILGYVRMAMLVLSRAVRRGDNGMVGQPAGRANCCSARTASRPGAVVATCSTSMRGAFELSTGARTAAARRAPAFYPWWSSQIALSVLPFCSRSAFPDSIDDVAATRPDDRSTSDISRATRGIDLDIGAIDVAVK